MTVMTKNIDANGDAVEVMQRRGSSAEAVLLASPRGQDCWLAVLSGS
jgi:hypothetical protein